MSVSSGPFLLFTPSKADRKSRSDDAARAGDFEIGDAVIEVTLGLPDDKHLAQVAAALEKSDCEVWLLTRRDRVDMWRKELAEILEKDIHRVIVTGVETFVGQNMSELSEFSSKGMSEQMRALFLLYNERWVQAVGTPGMQIVPK